MCTDLLSRTYTQTDTDDKVLLCLLIALLSRSPLLHDVHRLGSEFRNGNIHPNRIIEQLALAAKQTRTLIQLAFDFCTTWSSKSAPCIIEQVAQWRTYDNVHSLASPIPVCEGSRLELTCSDLQHTTPGCLTCIEQQAHLPCSAICEALSLYGAQVVEKDAAPETVAAVRESLRQELAQRMKTAASAQALAQARAQAEAHAHSQLEALLAQKAAGGFLQHLGFLCLGHDLCVAPGN